MTDYRKRIEELANWTANILKPDRSMYATEKDYLTTLERWEIIKQDLPNRVEAFLHQVEAETDRNSRIDELERLWAMGVEHGIDNRIEDLKAHREES